MNIDRIEALQLLDDRDIRVVRAKYVDSAEDAIAFAARREARDQHAVPIVLTADGHDASHAAGTVLRDRTTIRAAYGRLAASAEAAGCRIVAHEYVAAGTDVAISGRSDDSGRKYVALLGDGHGLERLLPIGDDTAMLMAEHLPRHAHRGPSEKTRRMLAHLVVRVSAFFENPEIEALHLFPVRLHENTYTVLDAHIEARSRIPSAGRLARHAHDRKSYDYHPSGSQ